MSLQFLVDVKLKKKKTRQTSEDSKRREQTSLSSLICGSGVWKISTPLTLSRRALLRHLFHIRSPFFSRYYRDRVAFRRYTVDITICNFIQQRYRGYIVCYGHFSRARCCRPLSVMTRKKEHVPRFVLINWSTCASLQCSVGSSRHRANKRWKSDPEFRTCRK